MSKLVLPKDSGIQNVAENKLYETGAKVAKKTIIPPNTEKFVKLYPSYQSCFDKKLLFRKNKWLDNFGLSATPQIISGFCIGVLVQNKGGESKVLLPNRRIGTFFGEKENKDDKGNDHNFKEKPPDIFCSSTLLKNVEDMPWNGVDVVDVI